MSIRELTARLPRTRLARLVFELLHELELSAIFGLTAIAFLSSLLLGGGTRGGFLSDALLQLICIIPLLASASRLSDLALRDGPNHGQAKLALAFCVAVVLVPVIQLLPLPYRLWTLLPNRSPMIAIYQALGRTPGWMPISVSSNATWLSALSLIPPLAIFTGTILLDRRERRLFSLLLVAFGVVSSFLGLLQLSQGPSSPLRFFIITNATEAVGFFANRNHFAALLYTTLLFSAVWAIDIGFAAGLWRGRKSFEASSIGAMTASSLAIVVLLAAEAMTHSRAGMALTMMSLVGVCVLLFSDRRRKFSATPAGFMLAAAGTAFVLIVQFGLYRILETFAVDPLEDSRFQFLWNTIAAARDYMPFGSGMGTFVPVYAMFEKPPDIFAQYINHAHDDIAELSLESGAVGLTLMLVFAVWFGLRAKKIWVDASTDTGEFDRLLARAATLVIALIAAHSFVDYPLRTAAMMGVFAFACGLMFEPLSGGGSKVGQRSGIFRDATSDRVTERTSAALPAATSLVPAPPDAAPATNETRRSAARWGENVNWPAAWRKPDAGQNIRKAKRATPDKPRSP